MNNRLLLFLLAVVPLAGTLGQGTSLTDFINCVELQYGPDNLLINGRPYLASNPKAKGHPYFQAEEWTPGIVYINGNSFPADYLKYNLVDQQLIIKHERPNGTDQKAVLSELLVDSFYVEKQLFVKQDLILPEKENDGYLEKIFQEQKLSFFRLQRKVLVAPTNSAPDGRYSDLKDVFYLTADDKQYRITQKKDFLACFPDYKSQIKKYMKNHSLKWKKMTNSQFTQLLNFCHDQNYTPL